MPCRRIPHVLGHSLTCDWLEASGIALPWKAARPGTTHFLLLAMFQPCPTSESDSALQAFEEIVRHTQWEHHGRDHSRGPSFCRHCAFRATSSSGGERQARRGLLVYANALQLVGHVR